MKTRLSALLAASLLLAGVAPRTHAQETVSTGMIVNVMADKGVLTLRSDQTGQPLTFHGMDKANIFTANGQPALIADLQNGTKVTVQYAVRGNQWYVSKVILPMAQSPAAAANAAAISAASAAAPITAKDGDITTQPGRKAAIDNDITTKPTDTGVRPGAVNANGTK